MAYGDAFVRTEVGAFSLADFAQRCGVDRRLLKREALRPCKLASTHAALQAKSADDTRSEQTFVAGINEVVSTQARLSSRLASEAATIDAGHL